MNLDKFCFVFNEVVLKILGGNKKIHHGNNNSVNRFSITSPKLGSSDNMNGPVNFTVKRKESSP